MSNVWGYVLTLAGLAALTKGMWEIGDRIEKGVSADARREAVALLKSIKGTKVLAATASTFNHAFDSIFGKRHLTFACFAKSALASTITGTAIFVILAFAGKIGFDINWAVYLFLLVFLAMVNWVPDYLSLLKTRFILGKMTRVKGRWFIGLLATDVAGSWCIAVLAGMATLFLLTAAGEDDWRRGIGLGVDAVRSGEFFGRLVIPEAQSFLFLPIPDIMSILPVIFYTSFMTAIWVGLYAMSAIILRFLSPIERAVRRLKWVLDIDNQPFASVVNALAIIMWIVALPIMVVMAFA